MKKQKGFTLVEIAIVLVIIGLIIGGILKGQEMIKNAKVKRLVKQGQDLTAAVYFYQDRTKNLPGDANANGQIGSGAEAQGAITALLNTGFIAGATSGGYLVNALGSTYYIQYYDGTTNPTIAAHWVTYTTIPWDLAQIIDTSYDDGVYNTGAVQASAAYIAASGSVTFFIQS